ncbi:hypothetical protein PAXRUDRAFT_58274, partial [Paxillus rubicundulus Ve08.2h10]
MDIIDNYSSYMWAIPLTGLKVGVLRSENGEIKCDDMKAWLCSWGTSHQFTSAYTSVQNGCVECVHHTLIGKARAM